MRSTSLIDTDVTRSTYRPFEWARSAPILKCWDAYDETVSLEAALDAALREFQGELAMRQASDAMLREAVARELCRVADLDPDNRHDPVPSGRDIDWPMRREFRGPVREIISLVGQAARPPV